MMRTNYNYLADCRGMNEEDIFEKIVELRGIDDPDSYFNPTENELLPLSLLKRIDEAATCLINAIKNNKKIAVFFDTDLDGITSGTIMTRYLKNFSVEPFTYIDQGKQHGLIGQDIDVFSDSDLIIIVDSLDKNVSQYKKLYDIGKDIIILDHHAIPVEEPYDKFVILVSSQREYGNPQLSGAGVVWKFCKYLDQKMRVDYADQFLDLAACGLVADMMDMSVMENRYIVSTGLNKINNPAIKKIVGSFEFNSTAIAFSIAPIVNAANRMGKNEVAMKAFLEDENKSVLAYIRELKKCKEAQNQEVDRIMPDVLEQCEKQKANKMIVSYINSPYGVSGLLGNKLLERYQKPVLVLKDNGNLYSGSMRAAGVDDFRAICNDSGFAKADGHELASGISIKKSNMSDFIDYIERTMPALKFDSTVQTDICLDVSDISRNLVNIIKKIDKVSGTGFKPVKILLTGISEYTIGQMSDYKHLVIKPNDYLWVIKWNFAGSFDEMEDHSLMGDELIATCTLDSGFLGRTFVLKAICDEIEEVD